MDRWMNIGQLDPAEWEPLMGSNWRQKVDRILVEGTGEGFGGRALCLAKKAPPQLPYEMAVSVKLDDEAGAAGLTFGSDGGDRHYGFYPTAGQVRLTRFDGPNVFNWTILEQGPSEFYRKGEWNRIKVRVSAERIECFVNGHRVFESKSPAYAGERIGLCKFRNTQAEFRGFAVGASVDPGDGAPPEPVVASVRDFLAAPNPAGESRVAQALLEAPEAGRRYLTDRASQLERDAAELRRVAKLAHSRRVEKELKDALTAGEKEIDLIQAALLVARFDDPDLEPDPYRRHVDRMARDLSGRLPAGADDAAKIGALKKYFFQEQGFHPSRQEYYEKANSYLNSVIDHREGIPITLSVLFLELGQRIGVASLRPHPLPGHFMLAYKRADGTERVIDVFEGGRELTHAEADLVVGRQSEGEVRSELMEPARKRDVIVRMLRNLQSIARGEDNTAATLRYLDLILALQPASPIDRLDRARLRAQVGDSSGAKEDVQWLLDHSPPGFDPERLEEILKSL
jgi:regulator of sirC expression with transglutaminase-like and TPR domain